MDSSLELQVRMAKTVRPGCERTVGMEDGKLGFSPYCSLCLFDHCGTCAGQRPG